MGVEVVVGPAAKAGAAGKGYAGVLLQYPNTSGSVVSYGTQPRTIRLPSACTRDRLHVFAHILYGS